MCGIAGVISKDKINKELKKSLENMGDSIVHRGPDSQGSYSNEHVEIMMRRLSIIDLVGGSQPLYNETRSIILIANGEIYNFLELKKNLEENGHKFSTKSDCETIIHAYEEYGHNFISELRGMFAFCLYDTIKQKIFIVRDRLGEKPLYYEIEDNTLFFSSEMKSILKRKNIKRTLDHNQIYNFFKYRFVPEPHTLFKEIKKLPPAHMMTIDVLNWDIIIEKYWNLKDVNKIFDEPTSVVRKELEDIEKIIIRSDVPVGIALSGGIDSSIIAILAAKYSQDQIHAFSVGYPGYPPNDERLAAKELASKLGFKFHDVEITKHELLSDFNKLVFYMDEPVADIAAYGYYRIFKMARKEGIPVLLTGFGGDELFWGYEWSRRAAKLNSFKNGLIKKIILFFILLKEYRKKLSHKPLDIILDIISLCIGNNTLLYELTTSYRRTHENKKQIFTSSFLKHINLNVDRNNEELDNKGLDVTALLTNKWLISNCINLGDRLSMSQSIEMRLPFLDYKLFEKVIGLRKANPRDYELPLKHNLIESFRDVLPESIIKRKKQGFNPPTKEWSESLISKYADKLLNGTLVKENILKQSYIEDSIAKGKERLEFLYSALVLEEWLQHYYKS